MNRLRKILACAIAAAAVLPPATSTAAPAILVATPTAAPAVLVATPTAAPTAAPAATAAAPAAPIAPAIAIVVVDQAALRAAPRDSALQQAALWQGEVVEVRGERIDYLQVWDHQRERGGFVRASQVRRTGTDSADAPALMSVLRFVRDSAGSEALGIGLAAAWLKAAPTEIAKGAAGAEALDALGGFAERLARRASSSAGASRAAEAALGAHLEVARRYGLNFHSFERDGRMQICYDGDAFARLLGINPTPEQGARAVLALTRGECLDPALTAHERASRDQWRATLLERIDANSLPSHMKNQVLMRRASVWSGLAYQRARRGEAALLAGQRALSDLAGIVRSELSDDDQVTFNDTAMRVNASRWAALPVSAAAPSDPQAPRIVTRAGAPGETCVMLLAAGDAARTQRATLAERCTYGLVWPASVSVNREGNALTLAVQPLDSWRELWVFRKGAEGWSIGVLPPAAVSPEAGYAEFAGWVPGGSQLLVAREARGDGKYRRSFEVVRIESLASERQSGDPALLGPFQRWQDAQWKRHSVSLR